MSLGIWAAKAFSLDLSTGNLVLAHKRLSSRLRMVSWLIRVRSTGRLLCNVNIVVGAPLAAMPRLVRLLNNILKTLAQLVADAARVMLHGCERDVCIQQIDTDAKAMRCVV